MTSEGQSFKSTATDNPVESGADVSDHVKKELDTVTLEVFVSNTPVYDWNDRGGATGKIKLSVTEYKAPLAPTPGAVFAAVGGAVKGAVASLLGTGAKEYAAEVLKWNTPFDAIAETLAVLEKLKDDVQLVDVVIPSRLHEDMFLESINVERNGSSGESATFNLGFKKIRKVEVKITTAPKAAQVRAQRKVALGTKGSKELPPPTGERKTVVKALADRARARIAKRYHGG